MNILIYGLPTSGKSTLAEKIISITGAENVKHINADKVRTAWSDWNFDEMSRVRQAKRMHGIANLNAIEGVNTIVDFVCPFEDYRQLPAWDYKIWMDTITEGPYEDTNKIFEKPAFHTVDLVVTSWEEVDDVAKNIADMILNQEEE
tara:strand:- start:53 stop:490 length:438 start_codon:yes stop_codon:yes gene_type:complete